MIKNKIQLFIAGFCDLDLAFKEGLLVSFVDKSSTYGEDTHP